MKIYTTLFAIIYVLFQTNTMYCQTTSIPDGNFEVFLINSGIDSGIANGYILNSDAEAVDSLTINSTLITDLTGLEAFVNLKCLLISAYSGTVCDVYTMDSLREFHVYYSGINNINLTQNLLLQKMHFSFSPTTNFDVTHNLNLKYLSLSNLQCGNIDLSQNINLKTLSLTENGMDSIDLSNNILLDTFWFADDSISEIYLTHNNLLEDVLITNTLLTGLDLSQNPKLKILNLKSNHITSLDLSEQDSLIGLCIRKNDFTAIDVSNLSVLKYFICDTNHIEKLDLRYNPLLEFILCSSNNLTELNMKNGNNHNIINYSFDVQGNPNLTCIEVDNMPYSSYTWQNKDTQSVYSYDCLYDLGFDNYNELNMIIYPNPSYGPFQILLKDGGKTGIVEIFNIVGQNMYLKNFNNQDILNIETNLTKGTYFVKISTENHIIVKTLIIE